MDLTGITVRKEMKELNSKETHYGKVFGDRREHIKSRQNKNDTTLLVKDLAGEKTANTSIHDTQILSEDTKKEDATEETVILMEDVSFEDRVMQADFVLLKNITIVHTQESIANTHVSQCAP